MVQTLENYVVFHKSLIGYKPLGQEVISKQITGLYKRLNSRDMVEDLIQLRLKQGFLDASKLLGIDLKLREISYYLENKNTKIRKLLKTSTFFKAHRVLSKKHLFYIEQLLDSRAESMGVVPKRVAVKPNKYSVLLAGVVNINLETKDTDSGEFNNKMVPRILVYEKV
ncbi:19853_t:CDS:2 [Gigaspora margarita]|uniref:19853_t:CDS:1 n=1 Tax=Gigaspora margarita TaxID=4874 RepID=A0ABM8W4M5_GIGMA|nr:19853_t:CDS:2 [Gigaspora margarita]